MHLYTKYLKDCHNNFFCFAFQWELNICHNWPARTTISQIKLWEPVSQKSRNFSGHETLHLFYLFIYIYIFLLPLKHMTRSALQNKRVGVLRMAFRDSRETGSCSGRMTCLIVWSYISSAELPRSICALANPAAIFWQIVNALSLAILELFP